MIYIIAGIAKSGKSIIARDILEKFHMQVISTDWIMMMLFHGNKELNIDVNKSDSSVSKSLEPYLEGLIISLVHSQNNYLIEGVHIKPRFIDKLMVKYPNQIKCVFLGYKDLDPVTKCNQLKKHANQIDNPWYQNLSDHELLHLTHYLQKESARLYQECIEFNKVYIEVRDIIEDKKQILSALF